MKKVREEEEVSEFQWPTMLFQTGQGIHRTTDEPSGR